MSWFQMEPPWGKSVFLLHVGIFVVWIPLVIFANRTMPRGSRRNFEHLLAELPRWARFVLIGLLAYALLNFGYFLYCTREYPRHGVPFFLQLRGFSGHWMMFYGMAALGHVALGRISRKQKQDGSNARPTTS
jgi:hypothetical protein